MPRCRHEKASRLVGTIQKAIIMEIHGSSRRSSVEMYLDQLDVEIR